MVVAVIVVLVVVVVVEIMVVVVVKILSYKLFPLSSTLTIYPSMSLSTLFSLPCYASIYLAIISVSDVLIIHSPFQSSL